MGRFYFWDAVMILSKLWIGRGSRRALIYPDGIVPSSVTKVTHPQLSKVDAPGSLIADSVLARRHISCFAFKRPNSIARRETRNAANPKRQKIARGRRTVLWAGRSRGGEMPE